jgi:hypothetical protein
MGIGVLNNARKIAILVYIIVLSVYYYYLGGKQLEESFYLYM